MFVLAAVVVLVVIIVVDVDGEDGGGGGEKQDVITKKKRKRRRRKKKKKKDKEQLVDEKVVKPDRRARIDSKDWKYKPPYTKKLPPLPTFKKPAPPIKYTGAPPPGKSRSITTAVKLFRRRAWQAPPPPPPPPKKPLVPRLASVPLKSTQMLLPPPPLGEVPWSFKHKIGMAGVPGCTYFRQRPLPPLGFCRSEATSEKLPSVPVQVPVMARFDKDGNLVVHVHGAERDLPENAEIQVTLVQGFKTIVEKKPLAPRVKMPQEHKLPPKLVPWPYDYDPNALDPDLPYPGRYPKLDTTLTQENYIRYRRIFPG
ncbi:hypothetical protein PoB_002020000 [Plakobranchus ocellatus]|uniref:Uncharacterized protein n=1 Tax=Plakobranchus ocellatus TaxID=259542 RepID=A0AAV3ZDJ6_9GAST|nr:hypothetical protein PoB_002020000 [Plakobranchus ocellatus]